MHEKDENLHSPFPQSNASSSFNLSKRNYTTGFQNFLGCFEAEMSFVDRSYKPMEWYITVSGLEQPNNTLRCRSGIWNCLKRLPVQNNFNSQIMWGIILATAMISNADRLPFKPLANEN